MIDTCPSHNNTHSHTCSFELSKQLEPSEPTLEDSSTDHGPFNTLPSASLIKKTLRHLFLSKGTAVGDSSPHQTHWLTPSLSERDIRLSTERETKVKLVLNYMLEQHLHTRSPEKYSWYLGYSNKTVVQAHR